MSYYVVDEQGRAIADEDIQAILDSKRKRIAELEHELALLRRQRVYDLDRCADAYKVTLKRLITAKAEKPSMDEVLEAFQDSAKRYGELREKLVETEQCYKAVCEGIMMAIDSSWRPNEARDWGRPELILSEYVGDLRNELAAEKAAREKAETDREFWKGRSELMQSQRDKWFEKENAAQIELATVRKNLYEAQESALDAVRRNRVTADDLLAKTLERDELATMDWVLRTIENVLLHPEDLERPNNDGMQAWNDLRDVFKRALSAHDAAKDAEIAALSAGLHLAHEQMRAAGWQPDVIESTCGLDACRRALAEHDAALTAHKKEPPCVNCGETHSVVIGCRENKRLALCAKCGGTRQVPMSRYYPEDMFTLPCPDCAGGDGT